MKQKKIKLVVSVILAVLLITGSIGAYLFFKPHRNVQETEAYATIKARELTNEFTADAAKANAKYLASDGNSKVLIVEGRVSTVSTNQKGEQVIVLKDEDSKVGVSATFTKETGSNTASVKIGDLVKIKGSITAGNRYDADLDLHEHAILVQCDIIK